MDEVLDTLALAMVEKIKLIVPESHNFYVFVCRKYRVDVEAFACVSNRGNSTRLILDANKNTVTAKKMSEKYGWVVVEDLYTSTCAINVNELEKRVHILLHADLRSIWLQNGMGDVRLEEDKDGNIINVLKFLVNIIHGPREDLTFAAAKQHKSKLSDVFAVAAPRAVKRMVSDEEYDLRGNMLPLYLSCMIVKCNAYFAKKNAPFFVQSFLTGLLLLRLHCFIPRG